MIAGLIPAAGSSARLGRPKLLVEFEGQSLIGRVVSVLRDGGAQRVVVVAPPADAAEGPAVAAQARLAGADVVVPRIRPAEMRESIELGLERLARNDVPHSVLLTPGDTPGIRAEIVRQLLDCAARMPERIVIPSHDGRRGHPIVLPWLIAVQIHSLPPGKGVNTLVAQHRDVVEFEVSSPEIVADLDTAADLQMWERRQNSSQRDCGRSSLEPDFRVRVRLFAVVKDRAGHSELEIELWNGSTVGDLRAALGERLPALAPLLSTVMIAVDEEYAGDDLPISPDSRLAVIPPVSGGAGDRVASRRKRFLGGGLFPR